MIWEAAAVAVLFGGLMGLAVLAAFRYSASLVERTILAAFAKAEKHYREGPEAKARRLVNQLEGATSVDEALYGSKGKAHPVPDIPPHPGKLGESRNPMNWAENLGTERLKNRR